MLGCFTAYGRLCFFALLSVADLFLHACVILGPEVELSCKSGCGEGVFFFFCTSSETGTWNNGIFPSIKLGMAGAVSGRRPSLAGLGKNIPGPERERGNEKRRREPSEPVPLSV